MISVAVATYNGEKFLYKQLESIINQSVHVDEIIICDDGSFDNTLKIIDQINDEYGNRCKLFLNENNLGFSNNFFNAINKTNGDYIFLSDQDDIWYYNKVERMISYFENDNDLLLLCSSYDIIDENGNIQSSFVKSKNIYFSEWLGFWQSVGCAMCFKKEIREFLKKTNIPQLNSNLGHDWFIGVVSSYYGKTLLIEEKLFAKREHSRNVSAMNSTYSIEKKHRKRIFSAKENLEVYKFLLENSFYNKSEVLSRMIDFYKFRINFLENFKFKYILIGIQYLNCYVLCSEKKKYGIKYFLKDIYYSFKMRSKNE